MTDHRIELHASFTVGDGNDGGCWAAHEVLRQLNMFGDRALDGLTSDFAAAPGTVDGVGWYEKWPSRPEPVTLTKRTPAGAASYMADVLEAALTAGADGQTLRAAVGAAAVSMRMLADELAADAA